MPSVLKATGRSVTTAVAGIILGAAQALAHPSPVPHDHPHGVSSIPGFEWVVIPSLLAGIAVVWIARKYWR